MQPPPVLYVDVLPWLANFAILILVLKLYVDLDHDMRELRRAVLPVFVQMDDGANNE
jgi:hypothetical protein